MQVTGVLGVKKKKGMGRKMAIIKERKGNVSAEVEQRSPRAVGDEGPGSCYLMGTEFALGMIKRFCV